MDTVTGIVLALFAAYVVATAWTARVAVRTEDPLARRHAAVRFLIVASLGVPILVVLILVV